MRKTNALLFAAVLAVFVVTGCHPKVKPVDVGGTTSGTGTDASPTPVRVASDATPKSTDSDVKGIQIDDPEGPLHDSYFDFDRYDIRADQRATLDANAAWLRSHPGSNVMIEGHCDERGTEEYNLALGDRRAKSARKYLEDLGIPASRMSTVTLGKTKPADTGHDESAWAKNRRAHFIVGGVKTGRN